MLAVSPDYSHAPDYFARQYYAQFYSQGVNQAAQGGCPPGYRSVLISAYPIRYACVPDYSYRNPPPSWMSSSPQTCDSVGGMWDSFANACTGWLGQTNPNQAPINPSSVLPPNLLGMGKWQAIALLNAFGFEVWLLQEDYVSGGTPPGYNPRRADIVVMNGIVVSVSVG